MATVTGTFLAATGLATTANIRCERLSTAGVIGSGAVLGSGLVVVSAADFAATGAALGQGLWRLSWWDGPKPCSVDITVPTGTGTFDVQVIADGSDAGVVLQQWFANAAAVGAVEIAEVVSTIYLAADSNTPPARGVLFRREATDDDADGVRVVADSTGATFVRYSP